jgi:hypothetical protein
MEEGKKPVLHFWADGVRGGGGGSGANRDTETGDPARLPAQVAGRWGLTLLMQISIIVKRWFYLLFFLFSRVQ